MTKSSDCSNMDSTKLPDCLTSEDWSECRIRSKLYRGCSCRRRSTATYFISNAGAKSLNFWTHHPHRDMMTIPRFIMMTFCRPDIVRCQLMMIHPCLEFGQKGSLGVSIKGRGRLMRSRTQRKFQKSKVTQTPQSPRRSLTTIKISK